ncbi:hypothetical protein V8C26DRAFT_396758 [Trichoderma gracile]
MLCVRQEEPQALQGQYTYSKADRTCVYLRGQSGASNTKPFHLFSPSIKPLHPAFYLKLHSHERIALLMSPTFFSSSALPPMASLRLSSYCVGLASLLTSTCVQPERHVDVSTTHTEHRMSCTSIEWNVASTVDLRLFSSSELLHPHVASKNRSLMTDYMLRFVPHAHEGLKTRTCPYELVPVFPFQFGTALCTVRVCAACLLSTQPGQ